MTNQKCNAIVNVIVMLCRILENRVVDQILKSADQILKMQFG